MPTYVLSKVKRTGSGQKVGDLKDQDAPTDELTTLEETDGLVIDDDSGSEIKIIKRSTFMAWLNGIIAPTWANVTGKPSLAAVSTLTQAEYTALEKEASTFYVIR